MKVYQSVFVAVLILGLSQCVPVIKKSGRANNHAHFSGDVIVEDCSPPSKVSGVQVDVAGCRGHIKHPQHTTHKEKREAGMAEEKKMDNEFIAEPVKEEPSSFEKALEDEKPVDEPMNAENDKKEETPEEGERFFGLFGNLLGFKRPVITVPAPVQVATQQASGITVGAPGGPSITMAIPPGSKNVQASVHLSSQQVSPPRPMVSMPTMTMQPAGGMMASFGGATGATSGHQPTSGLLQSGMMSSLGPQGAGGSNAMPQMMMTMPQQQSMPMQGMDLVNSASMMPVQTMSVQTRPVQTMPVQTMSVQTMPVQTMPVQTMPVQMMPVQMMPVQSMPAATPAAAAPGSATATATATATAIATAAGPAAATPAGAAAPAGGAVFDVSASAPAGTPAITAEATLDMPAPVAAPAPAPAAAAATGPLVQISINVPQQTAAAAPAAVATPAATAAVAPAAATPAAATPAAAGTVAAATPAAAATPVVAPAATPVVAPAATPVAAPAGAAAVLPGALRAAAPARQVVLTPAAGAVANAVAEATAAATPAAAPGMIQSLMQAVPARPVAAPVILRPAVSVVVPRAGEVADEEEKTLDNEVKDDTQ